MRNLIVCALLLAGLSMPAGSETPKSKSVAQAGNQFGVDLFRQIASQEKGNLFLSPYSLSAALGMTYLGARGETAAEMGRVLHFQGLDVAGGFQKLNRSLLRKGAPYRLEIANRLWPQQGYSFRQEFLAQVKRGFDSDVKPLDYRDPDANKSINQWVEERTQGKIKNLLGRLSSLTRLVLTNAIYFKGKWKAEFDPKSTRPAPFTLAAGKTVQAQMMSRQGSFPHATLPGGQLLELPYAGDDLAMVILLPDEPSGLPAFEKQLSAAQLDRWFGLLKPQHALVSVPRFKSEFKRSLPGDLRAMGMVRAFDEAQADFSGMDGTRELRISQVVHQSYVEVNEEGTEAAAATGVVMVTRGAPEGVVFRADHPFLYMIRDRKTGSILFLGRLADPT